ncbi:glycosyltransferase family 2 protein [Corynebacterium alimapuense]|uniref:Glycosyltransferase 2-like domain-containing protein n=1 Tax=Corynebacterium alimapuense TaxID=1576874 RepID=A0A3M8KCB4_9CORY|nr:glycosyltransferase family 2 protein [Corynebacterium alimapuense]RNE50028.1 hypothetical protein C5L39_01270 [Corynebacterium alimapuense]
MSQPLVTVIMPVADAQEHLPTACKHLAAIDYPHLEYLLIDDCSQDNSRELLDDWVATREDARVITLPKRGGVAAAREAGIKAAQGEFVWMLDCDDRWEPGILRLALDMVDDRPIDLICFRALVHEVQGPSRTMEGVDAPVLFSRSDTALAVLEGTIRGYLWNKIFRTSVLKEHSDYQRTSSQSDFLLLLSSLGLIRSTLMIPDTGYHYVQRSGSISFTDTRQVDNTAYCADQALSILPPLISDQDTARQQEAFLVWFYLLPCSVTPVHQQWPQEITMDFHKRLLPQMTVRRILATAKTGHPTVAAHALLIRMLSPIRAYPALYRLFLDLRKP